MSSHRSRISRGLYRTSLALSCALLAVGCVSSTVRGPPAEPPAPALQLLDTGSLEIPSGCEPERGTVYRTSFAVRTDGSVADVASESGDGCVQSALRRWVSTFEYRSTSGATPTVIDWIYVTASRGR